MGGRGVVSGSFGFNRFLMAEHDINWGKRPAARPNPSPLTMDRLPQVGGFRFSFAPVLDESGHSMVFHL